MFKTGLYVWFIDNDNINVICQGCENILEVLEIQIGKK